MTAISKKKVGEQIRGVRGMGRWVEVFGGVLGWGRVEGQQLFTTLEKPGRKMAISDWCAAPP